MALGVPGARQEYQSFPLFQQAVQDDLEGVILMTCCRGAVILPENVQGSC